MKTDKNMTNLQIAELLRAVAAAYELKDEMKNKFRIVAYERAADAVEHLSSEAKDIWDEGKLEEIPAVGPSIAEHLAEIFKIGKSKHFEKLMKDYSPAIFELMKLPKIGPKTASKLVTKLGIKSILDLEKAAKEGKISNLEGFGQESQNEILKSIEQAKNTSKRYLLPYAQTISREIIEWMSESKFVKRADPLGSLRRQAATVGDIDISVASDNPREVLNHFVQYPNSKRTIEKGVTTASILLPGEIQVDLMVQSPEAYGALLQHFTGSKHHNIALRECAIKHGMSLSEYGIKIKGKLQKFNDEEKFYKRLGMDWIPPELREDSGEIEAALQHGLPKLLELKEIKSDLQIHSDFDTQTSHDLGESSMQEIIDKANSLKYEYIAFTEHNPSRSHHSQEDIIDILKRKKEAVDKLNYSLVKNMKTSVKKVFNSLEIDILPNGELPLSENALELLDFALVSIHSSFDLDKAKMTTRVLSGLNHPKVLIFAHPTARKINMREGIELDWPRIFDFCKKKNKFIEINADPMRLDLPDTLVREALKAGIKLSLGTDAHHKDGLGNMVFGVSVARRGWATKEDILNTRSLNDFEKMLK